MQGRKEGGKEAEESTIFRYSIFFIFPFLKLLFGRQKVKETVEI